MIAVLDSPGGSAAALVAVGDRLDLAMCLTRAISDLERADRIILPDAENFAGLVRWLRDERLVGPLLQAADEGRPLLGVGRGLHVLLDLSYEDGQHTGLGLLHGKAVRFDFGHHPVAMHFVVPHRGWNQVHWSRPCPLLEGLQSGSYCYFNHACHAEPLEASDAVAQGNHGIDFCAVMRHERIYGVQFLPERSDEAGRTVLRNFARL